MGEARGAANTDISGQKTLISANIRTYFERVPQKAVVKQKIRNKGGIFCSLTINFYKKFIVKKVYKMTSVLKMLQSTVNFTENLTITTSNL